MNNIIQIWKLVKLRQRVNGPIEHGNIKLHMGIAHEYGCVKDLKWLPVQYQSEHFAILAASFCNGNTYIFNVPLSMESSNEPNYGEFFKECKVYELNTSKRHIHLIAFRVSHCSFVGTYCYDKPS